MTETEQALRLEVAADPAAPATIHGELRRWLADVGVRGWVVDDLLVASDEICFETILLPEVTRLEVNATLHEAVVQLDISCDRRLRRALRLVPWDTGVEVVGPEVIDDLTPQLALAYQVADTFAVRSFPDHTVVELTKVLA